MTDKKAVTAPRSVKGAEDATRKRPEEINSDGVDTYPDPETFKGGTREQYIQAQAENLRAAKGVGHDGELGAVTAVELGEVDTTHPDVDSKILYGEGARHAITEGDGDDRPKSLEEEAAAAEGPTDEEKREAEEVTRKNREAQRKAEKSDKQ